MKNGNYIKIQTEKGIVYAHYKHIKTIEEKNGSTVLKLKDGKKIKTAMQSLEIISEIERIDYANI